MISLRRVRAADGPRRSALVARNLDDLRPWLDWALDEPLDDGTEQALLARWERDWESGRERHHFVVADGVEVGMVGLVRRDRRGAVELGYWLDGAARGRGTMTAAAGLAVDAAFADDDVEEVLVRHDRDNTASRGVPLRLGFRFVDDRHCGPVTPPRSGRNWTWSMTRRRWEHRAAWDPVAIRAMDPSERDAVIALWRAGGLVRPWNDPDTDVDRKLAHSPDGLRVAVAEGAIVGTAMVGYDGHRGWINYLAVDPHHQGRGIGTRLIRDAEVWLALRGCPKINLQVRSDNTGALDAYRGLGYEPIDATDLGRRLVIDDPDDPGSTDC